MGTGPAGRLRGAGEAGRAQAARKAAFESGRGGARGRGRPHRTRGRPGKGGIGGPVPARDQGAFEAAARKTVFEDQMIIKLNGETRQFATPLTAEELLERLALAKERVVLELNMAIVPKDELGLRLLKEGDQGELVQFVGGGAPAKALVIVESPAKCKTIQKYLGDGYEIAASMGHVIDLPRNRMGIRIDKHFEPEYIVVKERKKTLSELKAKAKSKKEIYLACDPDREGEAISWHLQSELGGAGRKCFRVEFNEITQSAVREAFKHPREIDMDLVGAQQARRVLDRLVGYSLSPLLWQKVGRGLSAGRVQSVALRLVVAREQDIRAFVAGGYWSIGAEVKQKKPVPALYNKQAPTSMSLSASLPRVEDDEDRSDALRRRRARHQRERRP